MTFESNVSASQHYLICLNAVAKNSKIEYFRETEFYSRNLATDICLSKMVAELLSNPFTYLLTEQALLRGSEKNE